MPDIVGMTAFNSTREISKKLKLQAGNYIISPNTYFPKHESPFWLRLFVQGNNFLELKEIKNSTNTSIAVAPVCELMYYDNFLD